MTSAAGSSDPVALARKLLLLGNQLLNLASDLSYERVDESEERDIHTALANDNEHWVVMAEQLYRDRRRRARFLPPDLLGEPAWDILLDLYIAEKRNQSVSVTSACIGADVPLTTALRWLKQLEEQGLIERTEDAHDARRRYMRLSENGYRQMTGYFADARSWFLSPAVLRRIPRERERADRSLGNSPDAAAIQTARNR